MVAAPVTDSNRTDRSCSNPPPSGHDVDTVRLRIDQPVDERRLASLPEYERHDGDVGWLRSTAKLRNLRVTVRPSGVKVRGSLAAFISGTNAVPFDHDRLEEAFGEIADTLGLPLLDVLAARVMRLDAGVNVPLGVPVVEVTGNLRSSKHGRVVPRGRASSGVELSNRGLYVYDKRAERGKRGVDPSYGDGPLARVELRYTKDVDRQLKRPVTAGLLCRRPFYEELGRRLVEYVDATPFRRTVRLKEFRTVRDLRRAYAVLGIRAHGDFEAALASVEAARVEGRLKPCQSHALRRELEELRTSPELSEPLDVALRFRHAVRDAVYG